ncbi:UDP-N-acetylmuramate dehydrogenase [Candidatus Gottesmanbacteria bacterium]|nr:UDP-N-acetylmuramate dehydrogenase [Candidatus Gottesmanbacteria bacterium]
MNITLQKNVPLAAFTTFKIGGPAEFFYEVRSVEELVEAVAKARELGIPITILGGGSNVLIGDKGIRGLVIKNNTGTITIRGMKGKFERGEARGSVFVEADSGVVFNKLVRFSVEEGLGGLEAHLGLPGTVGGAIFMNSKWTKPVRYVGDAVYQVAILSRQNEVKVVDRSYFRFAYDTSIIQKTGDIVLRVVFRLVPKEKQSLWEVANQSVAYRRESQPQGVKSPGCTFRNISKAQAVAAATPNHTTSAGFLVDRAGLKGVAVGDAQISPIHANFIINNGRASARDVVELIELARAKVKEQFGVELQEEIVRLGEF